ncbi:MAG: aldo/keto reductase [Actinobacteria bacterium]|nr:aldo/keto reductase [Actinomycetota bacterium]
MTIQGNLVNGEQRELGALGTKVGAVSFGCWRFTGSDVQADTALIEHALDLGMNLVDTADVYGLDWGGSGFGANETALGDVLRGTPSLRDRMVLATKVGIVPGVPYVSDPAYLVQATEASLQRLGTDHVDLLQVHRPDPFTHPSLVAEALAGLCQRGLVRSVGVSNHTPAQVRTLAAHLAQRGLSLATSQPEFSALRLNAMRDGSFDICMELGVTPMAWSPLSGGRLATGHNVPKALNAVLRQLASREGVSPAVIAVAFVLAHPARLIAVVGSQNPERLTELARATTVHLDRTDVYAIIQASDGASLP